MNKKTKVSLIFIFISMSPALFSMGALKALNKVRIVKISLASTLGAGILIPTLSSFTHDNNQKNNAIDLKKKLIQFQPRYHVKKYDVIHMPM